MSPRHKASIEFNIGDQVVIIGLANAKHHNGKRGTIVSVPKDGVGVEVGRYGVKLDTDDEPLTSKPLGLKRTNIMLAPDTKTTHPTLFRVGGRVKLQNLNAKEYNGKYATIVKQSDPSNEGRVGVRVDGRPRHEAMAVRPDKLVLVPKTTSEQKKELDRMHNSVTPTNEESLDPDQMAMSRMMMNQFVMSDPARQIQIFGRTIEPIPDFYQELQDEGNGRIGRWIPKGVDLAWANDYLQRSYEHASALPHMFEFVFKQSSYKPTEKDFMKRLWTNDPKKMKWFVGAVPGSIYTEHINHPYATYIRHNFSNQTYRRELLQQGKTHVAVGFVDLGILLAADLKSELGRDDPPLRFVGIEQSAHSVAKTLLIWQMMKQDSPSSLEGRMEHARSILQVWFSTTWSERTLQSVRRALRSLCGDGTLNENMIQLNGEVHKMLLHWKDAPKMPLEKARKSYMESKTNSNSNIGTLTKRKDRVALAKYELTGEFGLDESTHAAFCGSIIQYDCPEGTPPSAMDESVFAALDFAKIMEVANRDENVTILEAAETFALDGVRKIISWCHRGQVDIQLICSPFEDCVETIASMKPWTMSWSNVLDYVGYETFHDFARKCSRGSSTIHFGYSMNWTTIVYGTYLLDYAGSDLAEARAAIIDGANEAIEQSYTSMGWHKRIRLPLNQNPMNTTGYVLEFQYYKEWADYFFGMARKGGRSCTVANLERSVGSPLACTGDSTTLFTWTYDPDIHLNGISLI